MKASNRKEIEPGSTGRRPGTTDEDPTGSSRRTSLGCFGSRTITWDRFETDGRATRPSLHFVGHARTSVQRILTCMMRHVAWMKRATICGWPSTRNWTVSSGLWNDALPQMEKECCFSFGLDASKGADCIRCMLTLESETFARIPRKETTTFRETTRELRQNGCVASPHIDAMVERDVCKKDAPIGFSRRLERSIAIMRAHAGAFSQSIGGMSPLGLIFAARMSSVGGVFKESWHRSHLVLTPCKRPSSIHAATKSTCASSRVGRETLHVVWLNMVT